MIAPPPPRQRAAMAYPCMSFWSPTWKRAQRDYLRRTRGDDYSWCGAHMFWMWRGVNHEISPGVSKIKSRVGALLKLDWPRVPSVEHPGRTSISRALRACFVTRALATTHSAHIPTVPPAPAVASIKVRTKQRSPRSVWSSSGLRLGWTAYRGPVCTSDHDRLQWLTWTTVDRGPWSTEVDCSWPQSKA
jgi:hypothetical protein